MEPKKTRIETVSKTTTVLILKNSNGGTFSGWCVLCAAEVIWLTPAAIVFFGGDDVPENAAIHKSGELVCSRSLIKELKKGEI